MITVSKTYLPSMKEYQVLLKKIWKTHWLTNNGEYVQQLEKQLIKQLNIKYMSMVSNGTLALQLAFKALELKGEVITTPFSFVATTSSLIWEGLKPVFADIDNESFNINPVEAEKKITSKTSAILAVHVYGNPCDVDALERIAKKYNLKLIFDAAHAFNVKYKGRSILSYGDASTLSFHATKTFHTIEGGAVVAEDKDIINRINLLRNFGILNENKIVVAGINAKMNEFQAAMGLANMSSIKDNMAKRKRLYNLYKKELSGVVRFQKIITDDYNYSYMPVVFQNKRIRDKIYNKLIEKNIKARKYFYPLITDLDYIKKVSGETKLTNAEQIANAVLCLPLYSTLAEKDALTVSRIVKSSF